MWDSKGGRALKLNSFSFVNGVPNRSERASKEENNNNTTTTFINSREVGGRPVRIYGETD